MAKWKETVISILEMVDIGKDLVYLFTQPNDFLIAICFAQTLILPFIYNVWTTNVVEFTDPKGNRKEIN